MNDRMLNDRMPEASAAAGSQPNRTLSGWQDAVLIERRGRSRSHLWGTLAVVIGLAVLETAVLAPVLQLEMGSSLLESWGIAALISLISAYVMHVAGRHHAGVGPHRSGDTGALGVALVLGWAVAGITITVLRVLGLSTATEFGQIGTTASDGIAINDIAAALLFLALYGLAGLLAFTMGGDRNDAHQALLLARADWEDAHDKLAYWEGQLTRIEQELKRREADRTRIPELADHERNRSRSLRARSQARVRSEIGRLKQDPAVMGIASPRHPDHPAAAASEVSEEALGP